MCNWKSVRSADQLGYQIGLNFNQKGRRVKSRTGLCITLLVCILVAYIVTIRALFLVSTESTSVLVRQIQKDPGSPTVLF